jgi:hypothetical protein
VALEATFQELSGRLHDLHEALDHLHVFVGDKPKHDEAAVADALAEGSLELIGALHEARRGAVQARQAVSNQPDLNRASKALGLCQEGIHRIEKDFPTLLASYKQFTELFRLANERPAWIPWVANTKQAIEDCYEPMEAVRLAMAVCWQEVAEHAGTGSISVRTTSIGQKIVPKPTDAKEVGYGRVT